MSFIVQREGTNLADHRLGAEVVAVTDEFFAPCIRMLNPEPPVFIEGKYDENGKWMDGWESRRKRIAGNDSCIVRLAVPGVVQKIEIDTSHFIGNFPPHASLEACFTNDKTPSKKAQWTTLLDRVELVKDNQHIYDVSHSDAFSHVRLSIFPDGGIARLKVYGEPQSNALLNKPTDSAIDLVALFNGGRVIACSDQGFGSSMAKLNYPDRGRNMGDGWETARRRIPGNEWVILQLAKPGLLESIELDTAHYKGNFPDRASVQAALLEQSTIEEAVNQSLFWKEVLGEKKLEADAINRFVLNGSKQSPITHVKINIIPDGGLSRVKLFGSFVND